MVWTATNPVSVGDPTKKSHYDALWDNAAYLKDAKDDTDDDSSAKFTADDTYTINIAGTDCFKLISNGVATLAKQSACRVYRSGTHQTINDSTNTKLQLNAENYDIQNEFDSTTNHRFTAATAGKYLVVACALMDTMVDGKRFDIKIYKNGGAVALRRLHSGGAMELSNYITDVLDLSANDYVEIYVEHNNGASKNILLGSDQTFLAIHKIA